MPQRARPPTDLGAALRGVRALLLDLDGVIVLAGEAIPGAAKALNELERRGMPYRIVTNTSAVSRQTLSRWSAKLGAPIPPERFESALSASAAWTARHFKDRPLYVLASEDARTEFAGQHLLSHAEAATRGASVAAVVIGDSPEDATYDNLNRAFRLVLDGAALIGMHRNGWWLTPDGPTLDSGAFVVGLEFASGRSATIVGKPSASFFAQGVRDLRQAKRAATSRVPRSRWSATTSAPMSGPLNGPACVASSCCRASTARPISRRPPRSGVAGGRTRSPRIWRRWSADLRIRGERPMLGAAFTRRPVWLSVLMGAGFGVAGQLLIAGGLVASAGWTGPVVTLLAPAAVAMLAALVIRAGWGATGFAIGQVVAAQLGPLLMPSIVMPQTIDLVLSLAAGLVGYAVGAGILLAPSMPDFQPPSPVDLSRFEADARGQLRGIDPEAPGAFERATVLLRRVNEQVGMASTWMYGGGKPTS